MSVRVEIARVQHQLDGAIELLDARITAPFPAAVANVRRAVIEELRRYRDRGLFPRNSFALEMTPVFIDSTGTRCAMAHLLEACGFHALVARVAAEANLARVRDLATDPELLMALAAIGLTVAEAARIQPSYCFTKKNHCFCGENGAATGNNALDGTVVQSDFSFRQRVRVDHIHGAATATVGSEVEVIADLSIAKVGSKLLAVFVDTKQVSVFPVSADGDVSCEDLAVPADVAAKASISSSCARDLSTRDARLGDSVCEPNDKGDGGGCAIGARPGDSSLLLLALLLGAYKGRTLRAHRARTTHSRLA